MKYLASTYWRGAMNVKDMRLFDTLQDAVNYLNSIDPNPACGGTFRRIYEVSDTAPPKLVPVEKRI